MSRHAFAFSPLAAPVQLLGIGPNTAWVEVSGRFLDVRFGLWRLRTPLENLRDVTVTGPYNPLTALGHRRAATKPATG